MIVLAVLTLISVVNDVVEVVVGQCLSNLLTDVLKNFHAQGACSRLNPQKVLCEHLKTWARESHAIGVIISGQDKVVRLWSPLSDVRDLIDLDFKTVFRGVCFALRRIPSRVILIVVAIDIELGIILEMRVVDQITALEMLVLVFFVPGHLIPGACVSG